MFKHTMIVMSVLALHVVANRADAQHTSTILFGDPNPAGLAAPNEHKFVHPLTAPYYHEDSFITTDIRAWFVYHDFPQASPIGGGDAQVAAVQLRLALTDSLQLVAYKDGYVNIDSGILDESGWNDLAAGLKWNFLQDWDNQFHMAVGFGYEARTGNGRVLQNNDEWRFWLSANKGFDRLHLGGTFNLLLADDKDSGMGGSDRIIWNLHADYRLTDQFSPVIEINGYHTLDEGYAPLPFSGVDVTNLGGGKGEDVITIGLGGEWRFSESIAARAAYETPLTDADDLFGYRWTFSVVFSF